MIIKRLIYLGYYIKKMDWVLLKKFFKYTKENYNSNYFYLIFDNIRSVFLYNISPLEFFQFRFFEKKHEERLTWAGTGFMYETIKILNPEIERFKLKDKIFFLNYYSDFIKHKFVTLHDLRRGIPFSFSHKLVLKNSKGQCGRGIEIVESKEFNNQTLIERLKRGNNDLVEEYIVQHDELNRLAPSALNTLRVFTTLSLQNEVEIIGVRLRISINSIVDNMAAGNVAAPVDLDKGIVNGPGVYSDFTKNPEYFHPITKFPILGFKIPYYTEALELVKSAALFDKGNRSIGWDVAISNEGPSLIEGNHDWCKLVWQLPVQKGCKFDLIQYLN